MADFELSDISAVVSLLKSKGISSVKQLERVLNDDWRSNTAWHDGYQHGFKHAHDIKVALDECRSSVEKMQRFKDFLDVEKRSFKRLAKSSK